MRHTWLRHIGTPHEGMTPHSGRFPFGSGENGFQRATDFYSAYRKLRKQGLSDDEIAKGWKISRTKLQSWVSIGKAEQSKVNMAKALALKEKGWNQTKIAEELEVTEGTVRNYLKNAQQDKNRKTVEVYEALKNAVDEKGYIDISYGVESYFDMPKTEFEKSLTLLEDAGYSIQKIKYKQVMTGHETTMMVLAPPGTSWVEIQNNQDKINLVPGFWIDEDTGNALGIEKPLSVDSDRIAVRYAEEGGKDRDGVIEIRRGVEDLDMGESRYCQARIAVDDSHYLKGMVMYADDLPEGIDIRFNTNKSLGTPLLDPDPKAEQVLKPMKDDPDNPFGATIRQIVAKDDEGNVLRDENGHAIVTSAINIVRAEGEWSTWDKSLSSQFLSKQPTELIKQQLDIAYQTKREDLNEILSVTEPTVRQLLLDKFAEQCDSDAYHLEGAAMPRQNWAVILPTPSVAPNEIYDPGHLDGETVVLIRYPHAGKFEIPELTVNNKNPEGKRLITNTAKDAVGIHPSVAEQLSGADFDGDTVLVIPNNEGRIKVEKARKDLIEFEPKIAYKMTRDSNGKFPYEMSDSEKGIEMGKVSNLITDMTLQGAPIDDIVLAVKHSMVVIDAEKHHLDYKQSEKDFEIARLREEYQSDPSKPRAGGASTLISRSTSEAHPDPRREKALSKMTPEEKEAYYRGEKVWDYDLKEKDRFLTLPKEKPKSKMTPEEKELYFKGQKIYEYNPDGTVKMETRKRTIDSTRGYEEKDLYNLSSGTIQESYYADYGNKVKALANEARKESRITQPTEYSPSAFRTYREEVDSLSAKLNVAKKNAPLERAAQLIANAQIALKIKSNPELKIRENKEELKKYKGQALDAARKRVGAKKKDKLINITDREWEAIQAGAIRKTRLKEILDNTDLNAVKQRATPRTSTGLSAARTAQARSMLNRGYTYAEVASALGVSTSTIERATSKK